MMSDSNEPDYSENSGLDWKANPKFREEQFQTLLSLQKTLGLVRELLEDELQDRQVNGRR